MQVIANLFFLVLGLAYGAGALALPDALFGNPWEPKVYPLIISAGMILVSIFLMAAELKKQKAGKAEAKAEFKMGSEGKIVAFVSVLSILYMLAFERLGYIISTFLFIEAIMLYISKGKKMLVPTLIAAFFAVGVYFLFGKVLAITLPATPFLNF
jgi:putative tricarboxylic transport membrane protein